MANTMMMTQPTTRHLPVEYNFPRERRSRQAPSVQHAVVQAMGISRPTNSTSIAIGFGDDGIAIDLEVMDVDPVTIW